MTADEADRPSIVVRDNRRVSAASTRVNGTGPAGKPAGPGPKSTTTAAEKTEDEAMNDATNEPTEGEPEVVEMTISAPEGASTDAETEPTDADTEPTSKPAKRKQASTGQTDAQPARKATGPSEPATADDGNEGAPVYAELESLRTELDELTKHLQRVTAEYANYRKRVDRDRAQASESATGIVVGALLPVLDDLDRARSHGDLVGPFAAVADQLTGALGKFGLSAFGEAGDPFDPTVHEAVSHKSSPDVTETTCVEIMRRGYMLGERLLRPALVGVADPE